MKTETRPRDQPVDALIEPNALYRFFSADHTLLYVGITKDLGTRLKSHNREKTWFRQVAYVRVEHFDSRDEVELAEYRAITEEHPLWNFTHRVAPGQASALAEIVEAWEAISAATDRYRSVLGDGLASGVQQSDIAEVLDRSREMIRQDAMTDEQRAAMRAAAAQRQSNRRNPRTELTQN